MHVGVPKQKILSTSIISGLYEFPTVIDGVVRIRSALPHDVWISFNVSICESSVSDEYIRIFFV